MVVKRVAALALVAAASVSLTACNSSDGSSASVDTSASTAAGSSTSRQSSASGSSSSGSPSKDSSSSGSSSTDPRSGTELAAHTPKSATTSSMCKTDHVSFSISSAMAQDEILVNLKNTSSITCSMHGFPGVDLMGGHGTATAARADISPSTVKLSPGEETRFVVNWIPATGASGVTYTSLLITPPNETHSESVALGNRTITIAAPSSEAPDVYVYPVGYGK
jgi:hypothetical protein